MVRFLAYRALSAFIVLFAMSVVTFLIFEAMPNSDPAARIAGREASPAEIQLVRVEWGLNRPIYDQYTRMMGKILHGSVISYSQKLNVVDEIKAGLPTTLSVCIGAGIVWLLIGVVFGTVSAARAGGLVDRSLTAVSLVGISTPSFLLGAVMIYYLAYKLGLFPLGGYVPLTANPVSWLDHLVMPWFALAAALIGIYSRVLRSTILDVTSDDFVRTARAKGISNRAVMVRHVLRNSLIPIISLWGLDFAGVIGGGDILVESVFNLHGVGEYAAQSIAQLDVPAVLVVVVFAAAVVVTVSAAVDVVYAMADPRIRASL